MSKAFDTISHDILIHKFEHYGIRGICKDWFASYLTNRSQYTEINGYKSTYLNINTGVPQGSILGPILWNDGIKLLGVKKRRKMREII